MLFYGEIYTLSRRVRRRSTRLSWLCTPKPEILHTGHVNTLQDLDKSFVRIDPPLRETFLPGWCLSFNILQDGGIWLQTCGALEWLRGDAVWLKPLKW